jgi:uncharacterized protein YndB with AHSA1/START domain
MRLYPALLLLAIPTAAEAEVVTATPGGFEVKQVVTADASLQQTWDALKAPARWWSKDHTYSDNSANLYLDVQATGCFCERLADKGSVEHMRIVYIQPPRMIRMTGALGPLQAEGVNGTLAIVLTPEGAKATRVTLTYVVGGYIRSGGEALAPKVDEVLAQQMLGLKSAAETPLPPK